jgi:peptidoglycan/LPS O-acetylase OafA/YrhL
MTDRKAEIQGLRAIAVGSVLLFHIWPSLIPGGYVGVDVFFVISGYLITGLLFREAQATGSISLLAFYARRVRRLLPAATAVLVAVAIFLPLLPRARWQETIHEIVASALYVENWQLARLAVDYLGGENAPSPLQHYWSLSIEEQFYIAWPLIMLGVLAMARRTTDIRRAFFLVLLAIFSVSLVASIVLTASDPVTAYFVTHTRV